MKTACALLFLSITVIAGAGRSEESKFPELPFRPVTDWAPLPKGWSMGHGSGVGVDSHSKVYLFHRGAHPVLCFSNDGKFLSSWGDDLIGEAHGLEVDSEDNIWVTDRGFHTVIKFDPKGRVLLLLGTKGVPGEDASHFDKPADLAFNAKGQVYVADGYGNSRVVKFSKEGKYLGAWGRKGNGPGEFNMPHTIAVDGEGRVYVGEKRTPDPQGRVQIFDPDGRFLSQWTHVGAPWGMRFGRDGALYLCDGYRNRILKLDRSGKILGSFGKPGKGPGEFYNAHLLNIGKGGEIFVAETQNRRIQKLVPR